MREAVKGEGTLFIVMRHWGGADESSSVPLCFFEDRALAEEWAKRATDALDANASLSFFYEVVELTRGET